MPGEPRELEELGIGDRGEGIGRGAEEDHHVGARANGGDGLAVVRAEDLPRLLLGSPQDHVAGDHALDEGLLGLSELDDARPAGAAPCSSEMDVAALGHPSEDEHVDCARRLGHLGRRGRRPRLRKGHSRITIEVHRPEKTRA